MQRRHGDAAARVVEDAIALTDHLPPPLQEAQLRAILDVLSQRMLDRFREDTMHPSSIPERPAVRKLRELLEKQGHARGRAEGEAAGKQDALLLVLSGRGLAVTAEERARIEACMDVEVLSEWLRRAITADSAAEALLTPQSPRKPATPRARSKAARRAPSGTRSRGAG